ncbi:MAG: phosphatidate cytidylyltransferase [Flavobacteriales bacterium]|nr:MAG: phosphatidate cytidylyltransferase [Flavobacteriales bacterium]
MRGFFIRAMSSLVYVALILSAVLYSKDTFLILFFIFMLLCLYEFKNLIALSYKWTVVVASLIYLNATEQPFIPQKYVFISLVVSIFVPIIYQLFKPNITLTFSKLGHYFLSLAYIAIPFALMVQIPFFKGEYQPTLILGIFILIWASDTFAYLTGSLLGKHKLYKSVSPNKTIEGALGGLIAALVAALIISNYFMVIPTKHWLVIALIVFIFGLLGDLIESRFKREAGVKDSSNFIPGHGGFLDRLDSLIFASPFVYVYLYLIQ